ncbi:hypothetical protein GmHk_19G053922 [Glycine max]|nr:hypothetical protein GmHk_19G053922 [Glycine max]
MNTFQHMTMVATAYQTSHECSEETIIDIITSLNGKVITNDDDNEIPDAVNTLIFTIAQHFIGDPLLWKDRSAELLSNLKCRTLTDFRWYRDTFLTRVHTREDSQQPFWKEKFLAGLPRSLGDKVRDKIRSQSANGDISYESLSYGQLISYVQKVALKICQDDKIQRQLAKEKAQTKKDLGSFCEQFGLPACPKQKKKQSSRKEIHANKPVNTKRFPRRRYSHKPSTNDQLSSTDDDDGQINTLTREQDLLFEAINFIPDPPGKEEKLKKTLEVKPRQKDFITKNKFDVSNILKRLENSSTKPTTIQDLQTEINNLKIELEEDSDSESANNSEENQPENLEDDMFMGLINKIKIQNFYINIKIIINDFVLETMALFDTGTDSNCILEGLIPTKFFEKTSEKLSTTNSSKLTINFKLSNAIIENQGLRINTNFLIVKNLKNKVILGTPFIRALFLIQISNKGITTNYLGRKIIFNFSTKPISRNINLIENKINQINFLKEEVSLNNIQIQLGKPQNTSRAPQIHYLTTLPMNSYRKVVMPPKASGISLRGGRSTGKGARLALPEPTIKKSSTSSGSPTQVGSSTQKTNLEGSLTQITSIKPEPSTQESPKPAATKQTSADYAWPIETLQALQDMGLTKFPKIIKKIMGRHCLRI